MAHLIWSSQTTIDFNDLLETYSDGCQTVDMGFILYILEKTCGCVRNLVLPKYILLDDEPTHELSKCLTII